MTKKAVLTRFDDSWDKQITEEFTNVEAIHFGFKSIIIETKKAVYPRDINKVIDIVLNPKI